MKTKLKLTHPRRELLYLEKLSKSALIDIIGDLMDILNGEGYDIVTNEGWRVADLIEFCAPRLEARGDKEPANWKPGALRPLPREDLELRGSVTTQYKTKAAG